jgi:hypothetical protein
MVSSLIAIWLAGAERRAAARVPVRELTLTVIRELTELARNAKLGTQDDVRESIRVLGRELNALVAVMRPRDAPVAQFISLVLGEAAATQDREILHSAGYWLSAAMEGWLSGRYSSREFSASMPPDRHHLWIDDPQISDWSKVISGEISHVSKASER